MSLGSRITTAVAANSALVALVGQRVYAIEASQGETLPHIVWQKISSEPFSSMREVNSEANSFNRVQFTVFASTFESIEAISAALITALDNVAILDGHPASFEDDRDLSSDVPGIYARALDFTF